MTFHYLHNNLHANAKCLSNNFFNARALRVSTLKLNFNVKITFEFLLKQKNKKKIFLVRDKAKLKSKAKRFSYQITRKHEILFQGFINFFQAQPHLFNPSVFQKRTLH